MKIIIKHFDINCIKLNISVFGCINDIMKKIEKMGNELFEINSKNNKNIIKK